MFLFIGSVAYGQDLISVEVNTDKLVEYVEAKDKVIKKLSSEVKYLKGRLSSQKQISADRDALNDSLAHYKSLWIRTEKLLAPRLIKKIKDETL